MLKTVINIAENVWKHPLNKKNPWKGMVRFLKWQLRGIWTKKPIILKWVDQSLLTIKKSDTTLTANIYWGLTEYKEMLFLLHFLNPDNLFVDVGANMGTYTVLASKCVGAHSISYEPVSATVLRLKEQIALNSINSLVTVNEKVVANLSGTLKISKNKFAENKVIQQSENLLYEEVPAVSLDDDIRTEKKIFLKIDVEGYESNVLKGASKLLGSGQIVAAIIEINGSGASYGFSDEQVYNMMQDFGFSAFDYNPHQKRLEKLNGFNKGELNTIFIADKAFDMFDSSTIQQHYIHPIGAYC